MSSTLNFTLCVSTKLHSGIAATSLGIAKLHEILQLRQCNDIITAIGGICYAKHSITSTPIDNPEFRDILFLNLYGLVAQLGAHHIRIVGVGSSNLLKSTNGKRGRKPSFSFADARRFE